MSAFSAPSLAYVVCHGLWSLASLLMLCSKGAYLRGAQCAGKLLVYIYDFVSPSWCASLADTLSGAHVSLGGALCDVCVGR